MEKRLSPSVLLTILLCYKTERDTDTSSSVTVNSPRSGSVCFSSRLAKELNLWSLSSLTVSP